MMQITGTIERLLRDGASAGSPLQPQLPGELTGGALLELLEKLSDGLALVDAVDGTYLHLNAAACTSLGAARDELIGRRSQWPVPVRTAGRFATQIDGRDYMYQIMKLESVDRPMHAIQFRDVTLARRREDRLRAFAQSATNIAYADSLATALDRLAADVRRTAGMESCTFLIYDGDGRVRQSGASGRYPHTDEYLQRLLESREQGAPLLSDHVMRTGRPEIATGWHDRMMTDPRFAPMRSFTERSDWDTIVVVPLISRGEPVGVFNGFYRAGAVPSEEDLHFLLSIAEQAAIAVDMFALRDRAQRDAAREERGKLARDLHDSVSQMLFTLNLQAAAAERAASGLEIERTLSEIRALSAEAFTAMRELIIGTRPVDAEGDVDIVAALEQHIAALGAYTGVTVDLHAPIRPLVLPGEVQEQLFRVAQEALHNSARHAPGARPSIFIGLDAAHARLLLEIADDGPGFDPDAALPGHFGIANMRERMRVIGGDFRIDSTGEGTRIHASIPWERGRWNG